MKAKSILLVAIITLALGGAGLNADEPMARLSDKHVKNLVKTIEKQNKSFQRALDSKFKRSILRGPGGEVQISHYLEDLDDAIEQLAKRFTGSYSASAEATELLKRADFMNSYVRNKPQMKGANEWDVFGSSLQQLAHAYGTKFPLPADAVIRRVGDGELQEAATAISKFAKDMRKPVRKYAKGTDALKVAAKSLNDELSSLADKSKTLASRIRSGKPASAEARQMMGAVRRIESLLQTEGMPDQVASAWREGSTSIYKIKQAFAL
jgi:predicted RNase H-like nuclease (RuvC/YqgF family)